MIFNLIGGGGNPASDFPEFTYTGTYALVDDGMGEDGETQNFQIEFLSSGTLVFTGLGAAASGVDLFAVGGGGGLDPRSASEGGGGGGYTKTAKGIVLQTDVEYVVTVGAGSSNGTGGASSFASLLTANGGNAAYVTYDVGWFGGNGGSGGGSNGAAGGSNGGGGSTIGGEYFAGSGQGSTTRAFGETGGKLYAAGGNGGGWGGTNASSVAAVNSGNGASYGTTNKGQSGIVILRNAR